MSAFDLDVGPALRLDFSGVSEFLLSALLRDVAERVLDYIVSGWPVDTARSLAGFKVERSLSGGWRVVNPVDYTTYVHDGVVFVLADIGIADARTWAATKLDELRTRQAMAPGQRQRVALRRPGSSPVANATSPTSLPSPPDAAVRTALDGGFIENAVLMLKAKVIMGARTRMLSAAEALYRAGRIEKRIVDLIAANRADEAIELLVRAGKNTEAQTIASHA